MKVLSKTSLHGIRASLYVASMQDGKKYVPINQISSDLGISFHFLTKILQKLTNHKLMISYRGPNGGVALAKPASEISLMDMINAIEPEEKFDDCILGLEGCGEAVPCPLHEQWGTIRDQTKTMFENTNLGDLGRKIKEDGLRLST
jgi:Rrf2 family iron-sulfur cluster assembly transcriptional regulator